MIRKMLSTDKDAVISLAMEFSDERLSKSGMVLDRDAAREQFDAFIGLDTVVKQVVEVDGEVVGMIVVLVAPLIFSTQLVGQEVVWYIRKDKRSHGVRLLIKTEELLKNLGCCGIMMVGLEGDRSCEFYERFGYTIFQKTYMKGLV